jgi:catechol 2,3-dioxygenase-like lactoylglutathione lyase family enzyme
VSVWYRVRDLDAARAFYTGKLEFTETYVDQETRWARLERNGMEVELVEGEPEDGGVAAVDVPDLKAEAERLRGENVQIGVVVELHDQIRLLDVFDQDGNRLQFTEELP